MAADFFNASTPPATGSPDSSTILRQLRASQSTRSRDSALARIDELIAQDADDDLPEELVPILVRVTSAPDAPLTFRSLHARVRAGRTSWAAWWHDPTSEAGGLRLLQVVTREQLTDTTRALQALEED